MKQLMFQSHWIIH